MTNGRKVYGRRIGSAEFLASVSNRNNTPYNYGISNDLILRMVQNTPENEKALRGL